MATNIARFSWLSLGRRAFWDAPITIIAKADFRSTYIFYKKYHFGVGTVHSHVILYFMLQ